MIDLELLRKKAIEYVEANYAKLTFSGTLILSDVIEPPDKIREIVEKYGVVCPNDIKQLDIENLYYAEPKCYATLEIVKGRKLSGIQINLTTTFLDVVPFYDYERDRFLMNIADLISSTVMAYHRPFFEAFLRGYLNDDNSLFIYGVNDALAYNTAVWMVTGKTIADFEYTTTVLAVLLKLPKSSVLEEYKKFDVLYMDVNDGNVTLMPSDRERAFQYVMQTYEQYRSMLLESMSQYDKFRSLIERLVEEVESGEPQV